MQNNSLKARTRQLFNGYLCRLFYCLIALLCCTACVTTAQAEEIQVVKIGFIFPLTGPMSSFGEDIARALPLLEAKYNAAQTKYKFSFILEDGKFGQTNAAITAAKKLVEVDGVRFLVVGSSGEVLQIAQYVESAKVLTVAGFASHPDVKKAGDYIFRTYIDIERGIRIVADDIQKKEIRSIAVISEESSFTIAVKNALTEFLGDRIVSSEDYALGDVDFKTLILKARSKKPQAYYLNTASPANFTTLVTQMRDAGVKEPFYTYYVPSLKEVQQSLGPKLDTTLYLDFPDTTEVSEDFKNFLIQFQTETGSVTKAPFNFRTNYNALQVVIDGITAVGPDTSKVKDFLYSYDKPSATGRLKFDANGDAKDLNLTLRTFTANPK